MGIPTVAIIAKQFEREAEIQARTLGLPDLARVVVESVITSTPRDRVPGVVRPKVKDVIKALTTEPRQVPAEVSEEEERLLKFEGNDRLESWRLMNEEFLRRKWGDGFPLVPPTPELVEQMLAGVRRSRDEIVTYFEPHLGLATIEKVAINAAMAGCRPEHLPVIVTAIECMHTHEPDFNPNGVFCSTGPHAPIIMVNGPVCRELGINCGRGALGPGYQSWVNTVIGRALRLCIMNLGHCYVGEGDQDTLGTPRKYSMLFGENEAENPWDPYHVEQGFPKDTSTVTAFSSDAEIPLKEIVNSDPEKIVQVAAYSGNCAGADSVEAVVSMDRDWHNLVVFCPEHAQNIANGGWSKWDVKNYLHQNMRIRWKVLRDKLVPERIAPGFRWLLNEPDGYMTPVSREAKQFHVVVAGGPVGKSVYFPGAGAPVTKEIRS